MSTVQQCKHVPAHVRNLCSLSRVDYADAFRVSDENAHGLPADRWAKRVLEEAPARVRAELLASWWSIGLRVRPGSSRRILGWDVRSVAEDHVVLGTSSRIGMSAELVFMRSGADWWFGTLLMFTTPIARVTWALVEVPHVRFVTRLLARASVPPAPR